ncbi:hypothetical protein J7J13_02825 [bacterium]|nr:hypothetical protein [bacterium]
MNKKVTIVIISILALALVVGEGWYARSQKAEANQQVGQVKNQEQQDNAIKIQDDTRFGTRLSEKEIKAIKNNNSLVWYEIPELGIKFKTTLDTKDDLRYITETEKNKETEENEITVFFYNQSTVNFLGNSCLLNNQVKKTCTEGALSRYSVKLNELYKERSDTESMLRACRGSGIIANINEDIICFTGPQSSVLSKEQQDEYLETVKDKKFGIYLKTTESISNK